LIWEDNFDGDAIDPASWDYEVNCWGGGNNEQQCYTDRPVNSYVADGVLTIVAQKEEFTGPNDPEGTGTGMATLPYTSARLRTKGLREWTFGRFEIRAKLPAGQGTWPAIWMLPTNSPYGAWAGGGEIDIMEAVNLKADSDEAGVPDGTPEARVHGTLHYGRTWPGNVNSGGSYKLPDGLNPADDFHEYALEWEAGEIRWYVDGVHYATHRQDGWYSQYMVDGVLTDAPLGAPFDEHSEFHLLLNLAVGGSWAANTNEGGVDESVFPQTMQVDYVRVYECSGSSPSTGTGCATIDEGAELIAGNERPGIGPVNLDGPPLLTIYGDDLFEGLKLRSYNPDGIVAYAEIEEDGRGEVINVVKTGNNGNAYINVNGDPADLRNWSPDSKLMFDYKINSIADASTLLVKLDSGWPSVSDVGLPTATVGSWQSFEITLADLIANGNSLQAGGKASLASIANIFVIDSSGEMDVSFDNIRIEGTENEEEFAAPPLFTMYGDGIAEGLTIQAWNDSGAMTLSEVAEVDRGNVFNVVKAGAQGNAFFTVQDGPADLSAWGAEGELVFDVKVNSQDDGVVLRVKMDSGVWPNVSDMIVDVAPEDGWQTIRIGVADLIDNRNSIDPSGTATIDSITNMFVIEPSGVMDVSFDNIRLEVGDAGGGDEFAPLPLFNLFEDAVVAGVQVGVFDGANITTSAVAEVDRGNVFNVVKTAASGNAYFNVPAGPVDLSAWSAEGEIVFDYKVNSKDAGSTLLIKMDSEWPNVSDAPVPVDVEGVWSEFRIGIADLIDNGNSVPCCPGMANISSIVNIFVIEPSGPMDVSFDNIRFVVE
jgi:beta-glucanase (GH16 family)